MPERDPKCVLSVAEDKAAELIAAWLTEKGFPAEPVSIPPSTSEDPITHAAVPVSGEFQIWVKNLEHAKEAQELIELQRAGVQAVREREAKRSSATGTITAVCEDCGKESEWPGSRIGMTEVCPYCHRYMDIPDPDEVWDEDEIMTQDEDEKEEGDRAD